MWNASKHTAVFRSDELVPALYTSVCYVLERCNFALNQLSNQSQHLQDALRVLDIRHKHSNCNYTKEHIVASIAGSTIAGKRQES